MKNEYPPPFLGIDASDGKLHRVERLSRPGTTSTTVFAERVLSFAQPHDGILEDGDFPSFCVRRDADSVRIEVLGMSEEYLCLSSHAFLSLMRWGEQERDVLMHIAGEREVCP